MAQNLLLNAQLEIALTTLTQRSVNYSCFEFRDNNNNPTPFSIDSWFGLQLPVVPQQPRPVFNLQILPNVNGLGNQYISIRAINNNTGDWYQFIYSVHSRNRYNHTSLGY